MENKKAILKQEDIMELLNKLYSCSVSGIPKVSPPISKLADDYISKSKDIENAARYTPWQKMIKTLFAACGRQTLRGFLTR